MKRFAAALAALALLLGATALAFQGAGYPQWDGVSAPGDSLCGAFNSERIALRFDPAADYSNLESGVVQACFYAYDAAETHYLEFYLLLPQQVAPGDVLRSGGDEKCSLCLYETAVAGEDFYYAGDTDARMAGNTSYELSIDAVESGEATLHIAGRLSAEMCRFERDQATQDRLSVSDARFDFTLPLSAATAQPGGATPAPTFPIQPNDSQAPGATFPALPEITAPPAPTFPGLPDQPRSGSGGPAFTLPPDYAVI